MEWLLILSALLNAATGAFTGTHVPDSAVQHEAAVEAVVVAESMASVVVSLSSPPRIASGLMRSAETVRPAIQRIVPLASVETDSLIE